MQEENWRTRKKTYGSKYGLETKCTYSAGIGDRTQAQWCTAPGKNRYATCFPYSYVAATSKLEKSTFLHFNTTSVSLTGKLSLDQKCYPLKKL